MAIPRNSLNEESMCLMKQYGWDAGRVRRVRRVPSLWSVPLEESVHLDVDFAGTGSCQ